MCFNITDKKRYTAKNDITVYKEITLTGTCGYVRSYYTKNVYEQGVLNTLRSMKAGRQLKRVPYRERFVAWLTGSVSTFDGTVSIGFHSFKTAKKDSYLKTNAVFTIPKGAKYYMNGVEFVSNKIIFKELVNAPK